MVLDTDVYSQLYVRQGATAAAKQALKDVLVGRSVAISVQTRAELLIWPKVRGWSAERAGRLRDQLDTSLIARGVPATVTFSAFWRACDGAAWHPKGHRALLGCYLDDAL